MALMPFQIASSPWLFSLSSTSVGVNHAHPEYGAPLPNFGSPAKICERRKKVYAISRDAPILFEVL